MLVLEHHFAQDIEALRTAAAGDELDVIGYEALRAEALRVFPVEVASGLEAFTRADLDRARHRYAAILREILEDRFSKSAFDAVLAPSDTFFYVRSAPAVAHALGVPFLVAQKETTISEHSLREHAEQVRRFAPPLADRMTVCSERHKRFWLRAGGEQEKIVVTGQPRFDFYSNPAAWPAKPESDGPSVLFLSYAVDAYHPGDGHGGSAWSELHRQTERGLSELARQGWRVLVKPHPQQSPRSLDSLRRAAGKLWGKAVVPVDAQADVRPLIVTADVVVGFQSTALLEAMAAGRPVVYTGWDPQAAALEEQLIPFQRWSHEIAVVEQAADLPDAVLAVRGQVCPQEVMRRRREIVEGYLGPLDGEASARTVAVLREEARRWRERRGARERELRAELTRRRTPLRIRRRGRGWARALRRRLGAVLGR
jgi:hypothetical protein